jgi:hypothetical protein
VNLVSSAAEQIDERDFINSLIVITALICKIPPNLPLPASGREKIPKGRNYPSLAKSVRLATERAEGRFSHDYVNLILTPFT